jgi:DNA polymerase-3 subunit alpha
VSDFVHLHCHSEYSLLDGMSTPTDIANIASSNGQYAASITDHGTMGGVLKFQDACKKSGVKPLFGVEAYFVDSVGADGSGKHERFHLILLAKNNEGLQKLFRASQIGWTDNFYYKPRIDFDLLEQMVDNDIVALSGCLGGAICKAIEAGNTSRAEYLSERFIKIFGDDFYYEVQAWNPSNINNGLFDLASSFNRKPVATADCHFPTHDDHGHEEVLLMISQYPSLNAGDLRKARENIRHDGSIIEKMNSMYPDRFLRFDQINPYIASASEIQSWFKEVGVDRTDILENTIEVADKCSAEIPVKRKLLPKFMKTLNSDDYLKEISMFEIERRGFGDEYKNRLNEELSIISRLGFSDYFLMVWDLIKWADNNNIGRGPGRGSVGGSLLAYLLDISKVDPIKYGLLFSRFLNPERNDYPDIDLDFEDKRRDEIKEYLRNRWGKDNVAAISIYGTFKAKSVIKDISRVYQVPFEEINNITPYFETLDELQESPKGKVFNTKYPDIIPIARKLENRIRTSGIHAAGMVVSSIPLSQVCPVESRKGSNGDERAIVTAFDMEDAESVGLIKVDILGLKMVSVIKDCLAKIKERHGIDVTDQSLKLDDDLVYKNFDECNTVGIFQVDAAAYRNLIERMGISNFSDLAVSNALVRPGALLSQGEKYIDCKKGLQKPTYPHPSVQSILEETYGTVIFQEQLMQMAVSISGFTWAEADKLRKIIGKKRDAAEFEQFREKFINNAIIEKSAAKKMWSEFELAALYMFNKSHAVAYSMLSYQTMWLKVHYPMEFIWSLLYNEDAQDRITAYLMEANRLGITINSPDVNMSGESFSIDDDGIRFGLRNVSGCGNSAIGEILAKRPFSSLEEFNAKCSKKAVNSKVRDHLDKVGAYKSMGHASDYDHEKYYLPILGFAINLNQEENEIDKYVTPLADFHEINSPLTFVKAVVRSTKKTPQYLRVEIEDQSGSTTIFCDRNAEIANRDLIYALIGDRTLHSFCDAYEYHNSEIMSLIELMDRGMDHDYSWLYNEELGTSDSEKSLVYIFNIRSFVTSKGKSMANIYAWDGVKILKIVIFPAVYNKVKSVMKDHAWFAIRMSKIVEKESLTRLDSYKLATDTSIISVNDYIDRKGIQRELYV